MKNKTIAIALVTTILLTACNSTTATESSVPSTEATTTTTVETTETTETTTEATTETTYDENMLHMNIEEVAQSLVDVMGKGYVIPYGDSEYWDMEIESIDGVVNYMTCGYFDYLDEEIDGYNYMYILFEIYEFDMQSEEYKQLCETGEFEKHSNTNSYNIKPLAINKQYALCVYAALGKDASIGTGFPTEQEPPYTIGNAQAGYEAFVNLE